MFFINYQVYATNRNEIEIEIKEKNIIKSIEANINSLENDSLVRDFNPNNSEIVREIIRNFIEKLKIIKINLQEYTSIKKTISELNRIEKDRFPYFSFLYSDSKEKKNKIFKLRENELKSKNLEQKLNNILEGKNLEEYSDIEKLKINIRDKIKKEKLVFIETNIKIMKNKIQELNLNNSEIIRDFIKELNLIEKNLEKYLSTMKIISEVKSEILEIELKMQPFKNALILNKEIETPNFEKLRKEYDEDRNKLKEHELKLQELNKELKNISEKINLEEYPNIEKSNNKIEINIEKINMLELIKTNIDELKDDKFLEEFNPNNSEIIKGVIEDFIEKLNFIKINLNRSISIIKDGIKLEKKLELKENKFLFYALNWDLQKSDEELKNILGGITLEEYFNIENLKKNIKMKIEKVNILKLIEANIDKLKDYKFLEEFNPNNSEIIKEIIEDFIEKLNLIEKNLEKYLSVEKIINKIEFDIKTFKNISNFGKISTTPNFMELEKKYYENEDELRKNKSKLRKLDQKLNNLLEGKNLEEYSNIENLKNNIKIKINIYKEEKIIDINNIKIEIKEKQIKIEKENILELIKTNIDKLKDENFIKELNPNNTGIIREIIEDSIEKLNFIKINLKYSLFLIAKEEIRQNKFIFEDLELKLNNLNQELNKILEGKNLEEYSNIENLKNNIKTKIEIKKNICGFYSKNTTQNKSTPNLNNNYKKNLNAKSSENLIQNGIKNETVSNSVNNNTPKSEGLSNTKKLGFGAGLLVTTGAGLTAISKISSGNNSDGSQDSNHNNSTDDTA